MCSRSPWLVAIAVVLAALLQSCASGSLPNGRKQEEAQLTLQDAAARPEIPALPASPLHNGLPALAELNDEFSAAQRESSAGPEVLLRQAGDFNGQLPSNRVSAETNGLIYSPDWSPGGGVDGLSYAMYAFSSTDFDSDPSLFYKWKTPPPNAQAAYIALGNWSKGRWDWFRGNAAGLLELQSLDPYFTPAGDLVVCFVLTGESPAVLDSIRIGGPVQVTLTAEHVAAIAPCEIVLRAEATSSEGTIAEYLWDTEGDGSFNLSTGTSPEILASYQSGARIRPAVRVMDSEGFAGEDKTSIAVYGEGISTFGVADLRDGARSVVTGSDGRLLVAGSSTVTPNDDLQFFGMDPAGELLFSRTTPGSGISLDSAVVGKDGLVYVCGRRREADVDLILQKWSQDGDLVWTRVWSGGISGDYFAAIDCLPDGRLVCAGSRYADTYNGYGGFVLCFNIAGSLDWARTFTEPDSDVDLYDLEVFEGAGGPEVRVCGSYERGDIDAYYAAFDASGVLISSQIWDCPDIDASAYSIASIPDGEAFLACDFLFFELSLAAVTNVGAGSVQLSDGDNEDLYASDLRALPDGRLHLSMQRDGNPVIGTVSPALSVGAMMQFSPGSNSDLEASWNMGKDGIVLGGMTNGSSPSLTTYVPNTGTVDLGDWKDFSPGYITPEISLSDEQIEVIDNTAEFAAGPDSDGNHMLIFLKP